MDYENETRTGALFHIDVLASFAITIGILINYYFRITGYFAGVDLDAQTPLYSYYMLALTCIAIMNLFIRGFINNEGGFFVWLPIFYVLSAFLSTVLSGRYPIQYIPFRFVELFYWVAAMTLSYYAVLSLNTTKFHVAIIVLSIPFLSYGFVLMRGAEIGFADILLLNPIFMIAFLMPVLLLLQSKLLKIGLLILVFGLIVLSYKRMPIIAFIMSMLVYFYFLSHAGYESKLWKNITVFIGAIVFLIIAAFSFQYVAGAFNLNWGARMSDLISSGGSGRIDLWRRMLRALAEQPGNWFLGHGKGALAFEIKWAHNDILEILYDFGLLALIFYVLFAVKMIKIFFQMKKFRYKHTGAFAASLIWAFWGGMTDVFVNYPYHFLGIALFWGLAVGDFDNTRKQASIMEMDDSLYIYQSGQADSPDAVYV